MRTNWLIRDRGETERKRELKTDRRCSDGRKITLSFHTKSMKPYTGKLTLRSTVRYSNCTLNEGERAGRFPWGGEGSEHCAKGLGGKRTGEGDYLEIMYSKRLYYFPLIASLRVDY